MSKDNGRFLDWDEDTISIISKSTIAQEKRSPLGRIGKRAAKQVRKSPVAAGIAVRADDTGRVLMLQRPLDPEDINSGKWEFPGGKIDDGEEPLQAAIREWEEEVGIDFPSYSRSGGFREWQSGNGKYVGYVLSGVVSESEIDLSDRRPDPDGSGGNAVVAWVDPRDLPNHNLRPALLGDIDEVLAAVKKWLLGKVVKKQVRKEGTCGIGERSDLTGCQPASGAASASDSSSEGESQPLPASTADILAEADNVVEKSESKSRQLLEKFKGPAKWLKSKGDEVKVKLTRKYGVKGAAAILGAGQIITWGITIGAPIATGLPIVVPPGGGLATSLALAGMVDLYKKLRGSKAKDGKELSAEQIEAEAVKLVQELIDGVAKELENEPTEVKPAKRIGKRRLK